VRQLNLGALNRGPLAMGLLTGKYTASSAPLPGDDVRGTRSPAWMKYFTDAIRDVLTSNGRTLAQGALAWLWARNPHTLPISGFKTVKQVEEDAGALAFGALTAEQMRQIDALLERPA
jgi:aryl-alcohol dehydrogenase-like predicted oxidoreductase